MYTRKRSDCFGGLNSYLTSNSIGNITTTTLGNVGIGITNPSSTLQINGLLTVPTFATTNLLSSNSTLSNLKITNISCASNANALIVGLTSGNTTVQTINVQNVSSNSATINSLTTTNSSIVNLMATNISANSATISNFIANNITTGNLVGLGAVPTGALLMWSIETAPDGFLLCNGASVSTTTYSNLFGVIEYTFGGSGSNFNLPDLRGRIPVGLGTTTSTGSLGRTGGSETHTLSVAQMPVHAHGTTGTTSTLSNHTHQIFINKDSGGGDGGALFFGVDGGDNTNATTSAGFHSHGFTTNTVGNNVAHENMQPFIVINYIIKT
jgi:microcystin-dependent protein